MLLDVSNVRGEHTCLDDIEELQETLSRAGKKKYGALRVQHVGLSTLGLAASLAAPLQHITSLTASHNRISTLQGVDAFPCVEFLDLSHNALRVLDAHSTSLLRRLRRLRRCDFSHNEICLIDFDASPRGSGTWSDPLADDGDGVVSGGLEGLTVLNLAHNQLIEMPDLRSMPILAELDVEHNRIDNIADLDNRLPLLALTSLSLAHNSLGSLQVLSNLTVLAETLKVLTVRGNPCVEDAAAAKGAVQSWLLFLLPCLETVDEAPLSHEERQAAALLFRHQGELSYEAMQMMNNNSGARLETYLRNFSPLLSTRPVADSSMGTKREQLVTQPKRNTSPPPSLGGMTARLPTTISVGASTTSLNSRPPSAEVVLQMMQKKMKHLSSVVEVLWGESMSRRVFATIVLQKYARGFLVRRHLPPQIQRSCERIRNNLRRPRCWPSWAQHQQVTSHSLSTSEAWQANTHIARGEMAEVVQRLEAFESLLQQMWGDMGEFRRVVDLKRTAAATTIQKYYRGHVDRKRWRRLKDRYDEFVASLRPDVLDLQRVCRGYLARSWLTRRRGEVKEVRQLQLEVAELRDALNEMRGFMVQEMRRQRLQRYADPERAMEGIISRHVASSSDRSYTAAAAAEATGVGTSIEAADAATPSETKTARTSPSPLHDL
ncbi:leucine-rich repeat protein (LRRP) [Trypanosoma grayi]|uniref:leucine-rich repeat protein (LRRP) n=1 Tax=Trypanosoma grayi TaxID=71804 RepID=UPI0004F40196|nr:leucine-rich repeat protein (LRRP) [Trypanosoma grayi]KEG12442.1 leucine-rich repeat protein (LRRP) [Trypanosoma grayi]